MYVCMYKDYTKNNLLIVCKVLFKKYKIELLYNFLNVIIFYLVLNY